MTTVSNPDFLTGVEGDLTEEARGLDGLDRFEARKRVVAWFEANGLLNKIEANVHAVPHGDRSGVPIEPWLTEQWYLNVKPMAEMAMEAVRSGKTKLHPPEREKVFFHWMENVEPWCVSRQLWWGHQIPAWYGPPLADDPIGKERIFVEPSEGDAKRSAEALYQKPVQFYSSPTDPDYQQALGRYTAVEGPTADTGAAREAYLAQLPEAERWADVVPLCRDPEVLDTWFSSALWPFSTLGWPEDTQELKKFYPNNTLVTAADILFFWVARMMMMGLEFMGETPFADVFLHGIVRDAKGKKMSKTVGNVIDPLTIIDEYGADAMRFTLAAMTSGGRDIKLSTDRVAGYRNFATKIWNAARFAEMNGCVRVAGFDPKAAKEPLNRWAIGEAERAAGEIAQTIESFRFGDAASAAYRFVWGTFCDWYLELASRCCRTALTRRRWRRPARPAPG